jgi:putative transcriptional regulator
VKRKVIASTTVADDILTGLTELAADLQKPEGSKVRYTSRTVKLQFPEATLTPAQIVAAREKLAVSQRIFAEFLGVSVQSVRAWEQGVSQPPRIANRMIERIRSDPQYWIKCLHEAMKMETTTISKNYAKSH